MNPARISEVNFRKVRKSYDVGEVDQFLRDMSTRVHVGDLVSAGELSNVTFHFSRNGYDIGEVDAHIGPIAEALGDPPPTAEHGST